MPRARGRSRSQPPGARPLRLLAVARIALTVCP